MSVIFFYKFSQPLVKIDFENWCTKRISELNDFIKQRVYVTTYC